VLAADGESPVAPRTGDEEAGGKDEDKDKDKGKSKDASDAPDPPTRVDLPGIARRIAPLPLAERNYYALGVASDGDLLFIDGVQPGASATPEGQPEEAGNRLQRYDFEERELKTVDEAIVAMSVSAGGTHLIARNAKGALLTAEIEDEMKLEPLETSGVRMLVDPRREWQLIFDDAVRMQPAYFYAANLHGLDWATVVSRYRPLLAHVGRREDLNDVLVEMIAELQAGHNGPAAATSTRRPARPGRPARRRPARGPGPLAHRAHPDGRQLDPFNAAPLARPASTSPRATTYSPSTARS